MSDVQQTTAFQHAIGIILARHRQGVTARELIGALVGPGCTHSQAQTAVQTAMDRGNTVIGQGMRLYAPEDATNG